MLAVLLGFCGDDLSLAYGAGDLWSWLQTSEHNNLLSCVFCRFARRAFCARLVSRVPTAGVLVLMLVLGVLALVSGEFPLPETQTRSPPRNPPRLLLGAR